MPMGNTIVTPMPLRCHDHLVSCRVATFQDDPCSLPSRPIFGTTSFATSYFIMFITTMITFQHDQLHYYVLSFITFSFFTIYYALLHHSSQFASWEYLLLLIPLLQTVLFIYSIYSIYYQGNLEMLMDPLDKRELEILSQSITYINKMSNKYFIFVLMRYVWDKTWYIFENPVFFVGRCLSRSAVLARLTATESPQGEACPFKSNT